MPYCFCSAPCANKDDMKSSWVGNGFDFGTSAAHQTWCCIHLIELFFTALHRSVVILSINSFPLWGVYYIRHIKWTSFDCPYQQNSRQHISRACNPRSQSHLTKGIFTMLFTSMILKPCTNNCESILPSFPHLKFFPRVAQKKNRRKSLMTLDHVINWIDVRHILPIMHVTHRHLKDLLLEIVKQNKVVHFIVISFPN